MPEIGEIARIVYFLRQHAVGKRITSALTYEDTKVYGKASTTHTAVAAALQDRTIVSIGQHGKYFWMEMSQLPHLMMDFGVAGWISLNTVETDYNRDLKKDTTWPPPKHCKFLLHLDDEAFTQVAFTDPQRLARIQLMDCDITDVYNRFPLDRNGPDPVTEKDTVTLGWPQKALENKKVPVKSYLLDQANISGVGNWVSDEILYHAKIHPQQYCHTMNADQVKSLHTHLLGVCDTAVSTLADSSQFPKDWLMLQRWSKGKRTLQRLPNDMEIDFVSVGGRTAVFVPEVQKLVPGGDDDDSGKVSEDDKDKKPVVTNTITIRKRAGSPAVEALEPPHRRQPPRKAKLVKK